MIYRCIRISSERERDESGERRTTYVYLSDDCMYITDIDMYLYIRRKRLEEGGEREESGERLIVFVYLTYYPRNFPINLLFITTLNMTSEYH